jgi:hypothetical protein
LVCSVSGRLHDSLVDGGPIKALLLMSYGMLGSNPRQATYNTKLKTASELIRGCQVLYGFKRPRACFCGTNNKSLQSCSSHGCLHLGCDAAKYDFSLADKACQFHRRYTNKCGACLKSGKGAAKRAKFVSKIYQIVFARYSVRVALSCSVSAHFSLTFTCAEGER